MMSKHCKQFTRSMSSILFLNSHIIFMSVMSSDHSGCTRHNNSICQVCICNADSLAVWNRRWWCFRNRSPWSASLLEDRGWKIWRVWCSGLRGLCWFEVWGGEFTNFRCAGWRKCLCRSVVSCYWVVLCAAYNFDVMRMFGGMSRDLLEGDSVSMRSILCSWLKYWGYSRRGCEETSWLWIVSLTCTEYWVVWIQ